MKLILRLCLCGSLFFSAGVTAARRLGTTQYSLVASMFSNVDGSPCQRPCLFGIQPERTPLSEAIQVIRAHPLTQDLSPRPATHNRAAFKGRGVELYVASDTNGRVRYVGLIIDNLPRPGNSTTKAEKHVLADASLGSVIASLGPPPHFQSLGQQQHGTAWAYYVDWGLALQARRERSAYIEMHDVLIGMFVGPRWSRASAPAIWLGFAAVEAYESELARTSN